MRDEGNGVQPTGQTYTVADDWKRGRMIVESTNQMSDREPAVR